MKNFLITAFVLFNLMTAFAQTDFFKPGWYYDKNGIKVEGYIEYKKAPSLFILFKSSPELPHVKISSYNIQGMVIEKDTFATLFVYTAGEFPNQVDVVYGFGQVLETGYMKLYKVHYAVRSEGYVVQQPNQKKPQFVEIELSKFIKQMSKFMAEKPAIVEKIKNKQYSYFKLRELVHDYNESFK